MWCPTRRPLPRTRRRLARGSSVGPFPFFSLARLARREASPSTGGGARPARSSHVSSSSSTTRPGRGLGGARRELGRMGVRRGSSATGRFGLHLGPRSSLAEEAAAERPRARGTDRPDPTTCLSSWEEEAGGRAAESGLSSRWMFADPQTGVAPRLARSRNVRSRCRCSMCPAIHINSRSWLRSSSTHEPSDPPPKVVHRF